MGLLASARPSLTSSTSGNINKCRTTKVEKFKKEIVFIYLCFYTLLACIRITGENVHYGTPVNPALQSHIPGGSSSGSAVAVAAGLLDFAIGN